MSELVYERKFSFGTFQTWNDRPAFECFNIHQIHGIDFILESDDSKADGIFGTQTKPWAIKTADCLPVLIHGPQGFAFFHAGWRGIAQGIHLSEHIRVLAPTFAFVGPYITSAHFEVGDDFHQHFPHSRNFQIHASGKEHFDLLAELTDGLHLAYPGITVEDSKQCTYENPRLNSFRLDKTTKRNWNVFTSTALRSYNI